MLLLLLACPGSDGNPDTKDTTGTPDPTPAAECSGDEGCDEGEICEEETCVEGDRNNAPEEALTLLWGESVAGVINPDGDVDYYVFEADGGEYLRLSVTLGVEEDDFDTLVTLRTSSGKVVTSADGFATGTSVTGIDAIAFAYLEEAGTYTVEVEHVDTPSGGGSGDPTYSYTLALEEWNDATAEADSVDDPQLTLDLSDERIWFSAGFLVQEAGDADWIRAVHVLEGQNLFVDGNEDLTGSDLNSAVRLWSPDGELLGEKPGFGPDEYLLYPHLAAGDYLVELSDAGGQGGSNHWGFAHLIVRPDSDGYAYAEAAEPNEDVDGATALTTVEYENGDGQAYRQALGQGVLETADDTDVWALTTPYDDGGVVVCLVSGFYGSLVDPTLELLDAEGNVLASDEGGAGYPTANLDNTDVPEGTVYLRVRPPADAAAGAGAWYRFTAYAASFSVADYADGGYGCP